LTAGERLSFQGGTSFWARGMIVVRENALVALSEAVSNVSEFCEDVLSESYDACVERLLNGLLRAMGVSGDGFLWSGNEVILPAIVSGKPGFVILDMGSGYRVVERGDGEYEELLDEFRSSGLDPMPSLRVEE